MVLGSKSVNEGAESAGFATLISINPFLHRYEVIFVGFPSIRVSFTNVPYNAVLKSGYTKMMSDPKTKLIYKLLFKTNHLLQIIRM